jgi:hypothetical protein
VIDLERDIEPFASKMVLARYWDSPSDHADFRAIVNAIDIGGGQTCDIVGVLQALDMAGYAIVKVAKS